MFKLSQHNISALFSTVNAIETDQPTLPTKNLIYSSWEKLWLCAHCSCCHRAPSTQCAARTVGFPRRDRTGFVEQRQLDFLGISADLWHRGQIRKSVIPPSRLHRQLSLIPKHTECKRKALKEKSQTSCQGWDVENGDPIVKMMVTLVIIIRTSPQMWSK